MTPKHDHGTGVWERVRKKFLKSNSEPQDVTEKCIVCGAKCPKNELRLNAGKCSFCANEGLI